MNTIYTLKVSDKTANLFEENNLKPSISFKIPNNNVNFLELHIPLEETTAKNGIVQDINGNIIGSVEHLEFFGKFYLDHPDVKLCKSNFDDQEANFEE